MRDEKSPAGLESKRGKISYDGQCEDTKKIFDSLTFRQKKVVNLLLSRKCSAADISIALGYSDPRSYVKRLIDRGILVQSVWVDRPDTRYKVYWIEEPSPQPSTARTTTEKDEQGDFKDLFEKRFNH